jgi:hypothetical protein
MRVLIGFECSGAVRRAFRALGHEAWSCDLKLAEDNGVQHIQGNVFDYLNDGWDMGIFHPMCTRLANSGALRLYRGGKKVNGIEPVKWKELEVAAGLFLALWNCGIPKLCLENPIQHRHARELIGVRQTQSIQPFEFGHPESKRTCLWLKNLPKLKPTNILPPPDCGYWENQTPSGQNKLGGDNVKRAAKRARTYPGIANAMAEQWGIDPLPNHPNHRARGSLPGP